jgi:hypothetical protein
MITNHESGTRVDEIADGIYRICTPLDIIPGGFTFNSYLIDDDEPLLFHTGYKKLFPLTVEAVGKVLPAQRLRWVGGSHFEGDEFGALNEILMVAPEATPFGSEIGVLTSLDDFAARPARGWRDGEEFSLGSRRLQWLSTPHVPTWMGLWCSVRPLDGDTPVWRSVYTTGRNCATGYRVGDPQCERRDAWNDGLLRARNQHIRHPGPTGKPGSKDARMPARQRLSGRRRCAAPGTLGKDRRWICGRCCHWRPIGPAHGQITLPL